MDNERATQNPEFAERFNEGDWVTGIGEHVGTSQVFKEGEILEPFSFLQSDNPDDFRIATETEIAEARAKVGIIPIGDLSAIVQANALWVFTTPGKLQVFLDAMAIQTRNAIHDTTTGVGRAKIASDAHAVSKVKVRFEALGKSLVSDWKAMSKVVDGGRKTVRDFCDDLRDEIRDPLTQYEAGVKKAKEEAARLKEINDAHPAAILDAQEFDRLAQEAKVEKERVAKEAREERDRLQKKHDDEVATKAVEEERERVVVEVHKPHSSSGHNLNYDVLVAKEDGKPDVITQEHQPGGEIPRAVSMADMTEAERRELAETPAPELVIGTDAIIQELDGIPVAHSEARRDIISGGLSADVADQVIFLVSEGRIRNIKFTETV